jgi:serine/threonine-protein kinase SRPK3
MQDHFQIKGPNGTHECLVLEMLGPSVADLLDSIERLPGALAKSIAKQTLLGLRFLHEQKIAHAGTVPRLAFTLTLLTILRSAYP